MEYWDRHPWLTFYAIGCAISFLLSLYFLVLRVCSPLSTYGHNLRQVGLRVSWTYGTPREREEKELGSTFGGFMAKLGLSVIVCALNALSSWLYVVLLPVGAVSRLLRGLGTPRDVRDARWRLQNLRMDFDGVLRNLKAIEGKTTYSRERHELLESLRDRKLISQFEFDRLASTET